MYVFFKFHSYFTHCAQSSVKQRAYNPKVNVVIVKLSQLLGNCIQQQSNVTVSWNALATMGLNCILYCILVTSLKEPGQSR